MQQDHPHLTHGSSSTNKLPMLALAIGGVLFAGLAITYWLLGREGIHPLWLIGAAALISIALPMLRANLFPSAKDCASEYEFHEKRLGEKIRQQISEKLGSEEIERLYSHTGVVRDSAIDRCREFIGDNSTRHDTGLRFALLVLLARFHETRGEPEKSIPYLKEAIAIEPHDFFANFRLAINYEWTGDNSSAAHHYRQALKDPGGISRAMEKLTKAQVERLRGDSR